MSVPDRRVRANERRRSDCWTVLDVVSWSFAVAVSVSFSFSFEISVSVSLNVNLSFPLSFPFPFSLTFSFFEFRTSSVVVAGSVLKECSDVHDGGKR